MRQLVLQVAVGDARGRAVLSEPAAEAQVRSTAFGWRNLAVWPAQGAVRAPDADEKPMPDKMEPGNPAMVAVLYLDYALGRLLDVGIERIAGTQPRLVRTNQRWAGASRAAGYFSECAVAAVGQYLFCGRRRARVV